MAIVNNGTVNGLPATKLPAAYTPPVVTTFTDFEYRRTLTLSVLKATVQNASAATTMANILADAAIGINKQVVDIIAADYLSTATVTTFAELVGLTTNLTDDSSGDGTWMKATAQSYVATVYLYVKAL